METIKEEINYRSICFGKFKNIVDEPLSLYRYHYIQLHRMRVSLKQRSFLNSRPTNFQEFLLFDPFVKDDRSVSISSMEKDEFCWEDEEGRNEEKKRKKRKMKERKQQL